MIYSSYICRYIILLYKCRILAKRNKYVCGQFSLVKYGHEVLLIIKKMMEAEAEFNSNELLSFQNLLIQ
jgi:hypothetical protein